jgi:hypothetical protein
MMMVILIDGAIIAAQQAEVIRMPGDPWHNGLERGKSAYLFRRRNALTAVNNGM